ncbi:hypothetical protein JTE90_008233 [Oedothorax gibbosus]|uniref:EF-hand domain-containing protein n=1 Tax=Oedothorax gibbosus TaxID=931172 RepID=A0AAV6UNI9_9ARAC|nr:hypothetical protein JTE90_008233 [Oedothorax gibbosus]
MDGIAINVQLEDHCCKDEELCEDKAEELSEDISCDCRDNQEHHCCEDEETQADNCCKNEETNLCSKDEERSTQRSVSPTFSRIASSASVSSIASFPEYDLKPNMKMSDVKNRLAELISSKGGDLIQACRNFDRRNTNKIPKAQFRQVLRTFCFPITSAQFDALSKEVNLNDFGKINYNDFFTKLSNKKSIPTPKSSEKISDDLPVDEVELRIKEKIKSRLYDVIRAFWLFDINKDGNIQKAEMRRIIRNYCFDLSEDLFNDLWKTYDPKSTGLVKYTDFLIKLGINADRYEKYMPTETVAHALCWSDKKAKDFMDDVGCESRSRRAAMENRDDPSIQGLPMEEILVIFSDRIQRRSDDLKNAFCVFDIEKNGEITLSDFREIIKYYAMPLSPGLFNQIWRRLGICTTPDSKLNYLDFLNDYCKPESKTKVSCQRKSEKLDCYPVVQRIKNHVIDPDARLRSVFTKISPEKGWQVTRQELKKALETGLDFRLTDDEFKELTTILDPANTNVINCSDFLRVFNQPCDRKLNVVENTSSVDESFDAEKYKELTGKRLYDRIKHHLNKNRLNIERAILVCDPYQNGFLPAEKLHTILNGFCFPLTDEQFKDLISGMRMYGDGINCKEFLDAFKKQPEEDTKKWVSTVKKLSTFKSRCPPELPIEEAEQMLRECVVSRKTAMLKDFEALDVCNVGVACKEDARSVLNKFSFRFNDKQFQALWDKFPVNKYDQLVYNQFLEEFDNLNIQENETKKTSSSKSTSSTSSTARLSTVTSSKSSINKNDKGPGSVEPKASFKQNKISKPVNENRKSAKEILYENAPQLKPIFEAMEPAIIRNYRAIRFYLRRADPKVTGTVLFEVLQNVLEKYGIHFNNENQFHILEYFDSNLNGKINYRDFLRVFVWFA